MDNNSGKSDWYKKIKEIATNKKFLLALTAFIFLVILISSTAIRISNLENLKDPTTEDYTAADPDALYFMRVAGTLINEGNIDGIDSLRAPAYNIAFTDEFTPTGIKIIYNVADLFYNSVDWKFIAVISPVIFFILGLIVFFFLCYHLTKSKLVALLASAFLAFSPAYLFRTTAGVLDHDALGMFAFFSVLLTFSVGLKRHDKSIKNTILWASILGILTAFAMWTWSGQTTFIFIIIPASLLIHYLFNLEEKRDKKGKLVLFNLIWIISFVIFSLIEGFPLQNVTGKIFVASSILLMFSTGFMVIDYFIHKNIKKLKFLKENKRALYSILGVLILGILFLILRGENVIDFVGAIYQRLLNPFGSTGRLGATVSENAQPYLEQWTGQIGKIIFWMFYLGTLFISINFSEKIKVKKEKITFVLLAVLSFLGILLSRVSPGKVLDGTHFISQVLYAGSIIAFLLYSAHLYFKKRFEIKSEAIVLFASVFFMIILGRSAARTIFVATPFVCLSAAYAIREFLRVTRKTSDEMLKIIFATITILLILLSVVALFGNPLSKTQGEYQNSKIQAKYIGSAANSQWQYAMEWVRENTNENSIFIHWWDYGYLIQTLSERKTVSDGGHAAGDSGDHYVGRYILTTPNPETALSYMKTWNVSYLLIDPTDLGKYSAYSKIGSDENYDRFSYFPTGIMDSSQTYETGDEISRVYQMSGGVDADIIYENSEGEQIFIPGPTYDKLGNPSYKAYFIGIVLSTVSQDGNYFSKQPEAVYLYNNQQIRIPMRYLYMQEELIDFKEGLDAVFFVVPSVIESSQGISINEFGAGIYMSPKVSKSLFAQLYLMDDPSGNYPTIKVAHSEPDIVVSSLEMQGLDIGEFVYYQGFRGPLKIWEVNYPDGTETHEELLQFNFSFGGSDYLFE
jgi:asparagine N-glycosylation enzyme membrane subunit Stt3